MILNYILWVGVGKGDKLESVVGVTVLVLIIVLGGVLVVMSLLAEGFLSGPMLIIVELYRLG